MIVFFLSLFVWDRVRSLIRLHGIGSFAAWFCTYWVLHQVVQRLLFS